MSANPAVWPPDWEAAVDALRRTAGVCAVIGGTDVGKSTFCWGAAARLAGAGAQVALLDADLGQARIGPPTTIGFAFVSGDPDDRPAPRALAFVGTTTPQGNLVPTLVAVHKAAQAARADGAACLIVDTCGWVRGPAARALKEAKFSLLRPALIVAIQSGGELEHLLAWSRGRARTEVLRIGPPREARRRDPEERRRHRAERFRAYFASAEPLGLDADRLGLIGASLWCGTGVGPQIRQAAESLLATPLVHAEQVDDAILFVCGETPPGEGVRALRDFLPEERVTVRAVADYRGRLVGLLDEADMCLAVGLLDDVDFANRRLSIRAPALDARRLVAIAWGRTRLRPDFTDGDLGGPGGRRDVGGSVWPGNERP